MHGYVERLCDKDRGVCMSVCMYICMYVFFVTVEMNVVVQRDHGHLHRH